jgi:hypothetical protein
VRPGQLHRLADHPVGQLRLRDVLRGRLRHQLAAAQHGDPVRDPQHLGQLVADEDDGQALRDHLAERGEQGFALLRREHRGGLVEDQDAGAAVQRLEDLDPLPLADRQRADARLGLHRQAEALRHVEQALRAAARRLTGRHKGSVPSSTLSSTDRLSASVKCWWTMPMPAASAARGWPGGKGWPNTSMEPASAV